MAKAMDISTQALTAAGVGFVSKYSPKLLAGGFTDIVVAGGFGLIGLFGASTGKGMYEKMSVGAIDGAASYFGVKMADWVIAQMVVPPPASQAYYNTSNYVMPKLVGYQSPTDQNSLELIKPLDQMKTSSRRSYLEI